MRTRPRVLPIAAAADADVLGRRRQGDWLRAAPRMVLAVAVIAALAGCRATAHANPPLPPSTTAAASPTASASAADSSIDPSWATSALTPTTPADSSDAPSPSDIPPSTVAGTVIQAGTYKCVVDSSGGMGGEASPGYNLVILPDNGYQSSIGTDAPGTVEFMDSTHFTFHGGFLDGDTGSYEPGVHIDYHTPDRSALFGCYP